MMFHVEFQEEPPAKRLDFSEWSLFAVLLQLRPKRLHCSSLVGWLGDRVQRRVLPRLAASSLDLAMC